MLKDKAVALKTFSNIFYRNIENCSFKGGYLPVQIVLTSLLPY
jgi:hypothetical protein